MSSRHAQKTGTVTPFLTAPVGRLFVANALPLVLVLSTAGVLNVVDGVIVGRYLGSPALAAVSATFPVVMLVTALAVMVGGGMSSRMARYLGAGQRTAAARELSAAQALALMIALVLGPVLLLSGRSLAALLTGDAPQVAAMSHDYLRVIALALPLQLLLSLHADALRNGGRAGQVALLSVVVNVVNIVANVILIAGCGLGVAGSALGMALAQAVGLVWVIGLRKRDTALLPLTALGGKHDVRPWASILLLGLPVSLSLLGTAVVSTTVILALRAAADREVMLSAYGIVTRVLGLSYLVQMAIALALQTIVGHNMGAGLHRRAAVALRIGVVSAGVGCLLVVIVLLAMRTRLGLMFTASPDVAKDVGTVLRAMLLFYVFSGPLLTLAMFFQAVGRPREAALLTLVKPWLLTPVLVFSCVAIGGTRALWYAFPVADAVLVGAVIVAWQRRRSRRPAARRPTGDGA